MGAQPHRSPSLKARAERTSCRGNGDMHRLAARARGAMTGDGWSGRVQSVHPRAINIVRADGLAVSVVADRTSMSAMGILAAEPFESCPPPELVEMAARMQDAVVSIDSFASIECSASTIWEGRVDAASVHSSARDLIHAIRDDLFIHGNAGGMLGVLRSGVAENPFVAHGRKSLEEGRPDLLVGCGPGLTPSGDDFLTGALVASSQSDYSRSRIERALPGTSAPGRTLLWMALQGQFPAYLVEFIDDVLAADSREAVSAAVRTACAHGETSGTDALAGFCWQMLNVGQVQEMRTAAPVQLTLFEAIPGSKRI